jgi:hypothetical protein
MEEGATGGATEGALTTPPVTPERAPATVAAAASPRTPVNENNQRLPEVANEFILEMQKLLTDATGGRNRSAQVKLTWSDLPDSNSSKGLSVRELVMDLVNEGKLQRGQKLYNELPNSIERNKKNIAYYWAVMELVELVLNDEHRALLSLKPSEQEKLPNFENLLKIAAYSIEELAFNKMTELDGKKGRQCRRTLTGMGGRYKTYCEAHGVARKKVSRAAMPAPAQRHTMQSFFGNFLATARGALSPQRRQANNL